MSNITSKIFGLAGMAALFAGMSFGQTTLNCSTAGVAEPNPILDRFEDTTALVADVEYNCPAIAGGNAALAGASATLSLNEPVTSKILGAGNVSEAVMIINDITTPASSSVTQGVVNGSQIIFSMLNIPASTDNFTIRFANVRVNASMAPSATTNFGVTESVFIADLGVSVFPVVPSPTVGIVVQGFTKPSFTAGVANNPANYVICTANPAANAGASFLITYGELFGGAFKTQIPAEGGQACGGAACTITNGEQGSYTGTVGAGVTVAAFAITNAGGAAGTAVAGLGTATHGTRVQFAFANIATGATVYVPTQINGTGNLVLLLTSSATGAFNGLAANGPKGSNVQFQYGLTAAAGAANAVYEVIRTDNTVSNENFNFVGTVVAAPNFATTAQAAMTVTVGPAPNAGTDVPTFVNSNAPMTLSAFSLCQTTLLFPFVAAGGGFDTGVAISNTGLDPLSAAFTAGGTAGSCTFNFYGTGAPTPNTNVTLPTAAFSASLAPGSSSAFSLAGSSVAPNFVGYMIAQCGFLYGHGFAYITYTNGTPTATAEGYLAEVLFNNRSLAAVGQGPEFTTF